MNKDDAKVSLNKTLSGFAARRLRKRAEAVASRKALRSEINLDHLDPAANNLLHELQVHQVELEMQNQTLRQTQIKLESLRALYFDLYDLAPVGYIGLNENGIIQHANLTIAKLLEHPRSSLLNCPLSKFILPADQDLYYLQRKHLLQNHEVHIELRLIKTDCTPFWIRLEANQIQDDANPRQFRVVITDINEQKRNEQRLKQAATMFESAHEGVMVTDAEQRILIVNQAFCELTGYSLEEILGKTPKILKSGRQDAAFYPDLWAQLAASDYWQGEIWNRRKNGEIYQQLLSITVIRDEHGQPSHYVGMFSDISQLKEAVDKLNFLAHHDALTGLPNRLLLFSRLEHSLKKALRDQTSLALLMLDLDRFKDVNDSYGHLAGDDLLQQVAGRLSKRLRGIDTVTRLGGDEFAVLLENITHHQDAALVSAEIIDALSVPWRLSMGAEVRVSTSIGISLYPENGNTCEELLQQADAALYLAKTEGRGNYKYFSEGLTQAARRRLSLESLLRRALERNEMQVYYQPQVDMSSGCIIGAEALLRWHSQEEGLIPPSQFIPVAEETGLIDHLGEWVLRETCKQGQLWIAAGLQNLKLAVNLSSHQFRHGDISSTIEKVLQDTGFPPQQLELELTESALMEREAETVTILHAIRAQGVRLSIDDFGTGYSSLAYLKRFPLDVLKIDKSFIDDIPEGQDDCQIATAIISMAHSLRLTVLAEGVETQTQLDFLTQQGCDYYQGYYMSPALPAAEFAALVQKTNAQS